MAKKKHPDPKASTFARIKRTESYAEKIRKMFAETVNEILALNKTIPTLDTGVMFSFDDQSRKVRQKVEVLLRRLHSVATLAIQKGVTLEWEQANEECDKLVSSCFGKSLLSTPQMKAWAARNNAAKKAFLGRSEKGLNLSQRVWKTVQQLRDEMEVAITVAIGDGTSAASMSRSVRQYLNDPDLMFRRFRYKDPETGEWKRKWKKRIIDPETGKHKWIDYDRDSYRTGAGVYKSSAKNAMRVTRTETNIAYRRADHERWQDMDFVLGQRVQLSGDHPKKDICDKLAGDYPKDFVFDGWHPQCFCIVTPITLPPEETADLTKIMLEGGDWRKALRDKVRGREITTYPENFRSWVQDNAENIAAARDRGTEPYFIRNNAQAIDKILDPDKFAQETRKKTPQEIAAERHAARTPDEIADIKARAAARQERIAAEKKREAQITTTANNVLATADRRGFTSLGISIEGLTEAVKKGNSAEIREQTRLLALAMSAKQKVLKATAQNVSKVAADYGEVVTDELKAALASGNAAKINEATRALGKSILEMKRRESAISDIIPDAHQWHQSFTMAELESCHGAVESTLARISSLPLKDQEAALNKEIKYVADSTFLKPHKIYPTWKVAQAAYKRKLEEVRYEIAVQKIKADLGIIETWSAAHPKSLNVATLLASVKSAISAKESIASISGKYTLVFNEYQKRLKEQARRDKKKAEKKGTTTLDNSADAYSKKRKDAALWAQDPDDGDDYFRPFAEADWARWSKNEKEVAYNYTSGSSYINEPCYTTYYSTKHGIHGEVRDSKADINTLTDMIEGSTPFTRDLWLNRGASAGEFKGQFGISLDSCIDSTYRSQCEDLNIEIRDLKNWLSYHSSTKPKGYAQKKKRLTEAEKELKEAEAKLYDASKLIGITGIQKPFMSTAHGKGYGFVGDGPNDVTTSVCYNIYCPRGTKGIYTEPYSAFGRNDYDWDGSSGRHKYGSAMELEVILQRGTKLRVTKAYYEYNNGSYRWFIDMEVIEQPTPTPF